MEKSNRKIQIIRGISICAVVMIHSNVSGIGAVLDRPFLNFCVAMFIFLSGYLTRIPVQSVKLLYKRRILKVLIPYVFWTFLYAAENTDVLEIPILLITANAAAPLYYISVYIQLVLLTPLAVILLYSSHSWIGWLLTPVSLLILRYGGIFIHIPLGPFSISQLFLPWFIYYYLGLALGNHRVSCSLGYKTSLFVYFCAIILSEIEGILWFRYGNFDMSTTQIRITSMITSVAAILLVYRYLEDRNIPFSNHFGTKMIAKVGDYSFGIYFCHIAIMKILSYLPGYQSILFPMNSFLILLVSVLFIWLIKRILGKYSFIIGF